MRVINVYEAKMHLSQLLAAVAAGRRLSLRVRGSRLPNSCRIRRQWSLVHRGIGAAGSGSPRISMTCQRPSRPLSAERPCDLAVGYACAAVVAGR